MKIRLSSQKYEIISYGTVFLFGENSDLSIHIDDENAFQLNLCMHFIEAASEPQEIKTAVSQNSLTLTCINFASNGTGLTTPMELALIDGKKIYFMFWSYLEGNEQGKRKARKVEYTLYRE